jgi:hypothetical protein
MKKKLSIIHDNHELYEAAYGPTRMEIQKQYDILKKKYSTERERLNDLEDMFDIYNVKINSKGQVVSYKLGEGINEGFLGDARDAINAMKETSRLGKELANDGAALIAKLKKATDQTAAISILRDHIKSTKKKIQSSKMSQELKDNFETSFMESFYSSLAKQLNVDSSQIKKLLETRSSKNKLNESKVKKYKISDKEGMLGSLQHKRGKTMHGRHGTLPFKFGDKVKYNGKTSLCMTMMQT